jgi:mycofactocin precursor
LAWHGTRLQYQHAAVGVLAEPCGERSAAASRTDDDDVRAPQPDPGTGVDRPVERIMASPSSLSAQGAITVDRAAARMPSRMLRESRMNELQSVPTVPANENQAEEPVTEQQLIEADDLIEEISIDGMCGVY